MARSTTPALSSPPQAAFERLPEEWAELLAEWGEPRYRAAQVFKWIHARGVADPAAMTDLPKALRERLTEAGLAAPAQVNRTYASVDGTSKLLVGLHDGLEVETVLIPRGAPAAEGPYASDGDADASERSEPSRALPTVSQCVSTQVGCAMGCVFCASGIAGLKRNLTASEIVGQVWLGRAQLEGKSRLSGIVLMGMGEPLHNYDAVARALRLLCHPDGLGLSPRRITLSTSGLVEGIDRLGRDFSGQIGLAVSMHAADDATRSAIMPINKRHPLAELTAALRRYPLPPRRAITIEYTLLEGQNDSPEHARALAARLRGLRAKVNLIPMNTVQGTTLHAPSWSAVDSFQQALQEQGLDVFVRRRKGDDIAAACGQLALLGARRKVKNAFAVDPD
jgi:23S rRNA (adenine2503-C2)-methyltransferase